MHVGEQGLATVTGDALWPNLAYDKLSCFFFHLEIIMLAEPLLLTNPTNE